MKIGKPKSKRTPVRLRHKIEKASAAKQRKQRKEAKNNPQWRSRLKKDPGIPNLFPYKAKLLAEIEEGKRRKAEEQMQRRELAKARRQGLSADAADPEDEGDDLHEEDDNNEEGGVVVLPASGEQDMDIDDQNPMAALLASAQARAHTYDGDEGDEDDDEADDDSENGDAWDGIDNDRPATSATQQTTAKKALPKRALDDPVKAVTLILTRLQKSDPDSMQTVVDFYQLPPLVTSATDIATRFLVEVARKRGRLGRGGVPNLHAAALVVLNDINDERLHLPASVGAAGAGRTAAASASNVTIVKTMAAPFRLEGLWGASDEPGQEMVVDARGE